MKLQIKLIEDGVDFDPKKNPVLPVIDKNGNHLADVTWVQRYAGRSEMPWPNQVVLQFTNRPEAMAFFDLIWKKAMKQKTDWRKKTAE